jgi:FAD/FMN-containing dehydrogenase
VCETTLLADLRDAFTADTLRVGAEIEPRYLSDWVVPAASESQPIALVLPRSADDISEALRICHRHGTPVVPQGGRTGLVGGSTPVRGAVLIALERMRAIEEIDPIASTITVQAGVTLQAIQEAADAADMLFPLDIGGRGSCMIGGNISTNAGGNRVLRYGMTRDLVLGLEAVLADGTIVSGMNKMLKNNAGYDLKQIFIGAEGTLGVVTRAVLKLHPKPLGIDTALCAFEDFDAVYKFLRLARGQIGALLSAFELMWPSFYTRAIAGRATPPLRSDYAAYVLIESMGTDPESDSFRFQSVVESALTDGLVADAVVAKSIAEARALWAVRDMSGELVRSLMPLCNYDVSIETGRIDAFERTCQARLRESWPSAQTICFGHLADSNLHMFVTADETPFPEKAIDDIVYGCVRDWKGSISAEHGIGLLKKPYLSYSRSPEEVATMKLLKAALDPRGILNPGKVFM